tara:strand:+ start:672 stop:1079 length:408 start_codon:yes stop_codon:yes gene_type:complete
MRQLLSGVGRIQATARMPGEQARRRPAGGDVLSFHGYFTDSREWFSRVGARASVNLNRHFQRVPAPVPVVAGKGRVAVWLWLWLKRRDLVRDNHHLALKIRQLPRIPHNVGRRAFPDLLFGRNQVLAKPLKAGCR